MSRKQAYLLLQSIKELKDFDFNDPLSDMFNDELKGADYFVIDNKSDAIAIDCAKQFIDRAESLVIICDRMIDDSLGALLPILNKCVKRKGVQLFCIGSSKILDPFIRMMKAEVFEQAASLRERIVSLSD